MASDTVLFTVEQGLAWITLNRPDARNAINAEMREALLDALGRVADDPSIRAAVLTEEAFAQSLAAQSEDMAEGMRAFAEHRRPDFKGR